MKKDYELVSDEQAHQSERDFVEAFWTQRWEARAQLPDPRCVERKDEYRLMQPFLRSLPSGGRILDGGCGTGEWTVHLTNAGYRVTGLDLSRQTIERLNGVLPNYEFLCGDIRQTGFPDSSFDAYFSWGTFEHFEEGLDACVREAARILKPGGWLFITVPFQNWRHIVREARSLQRWDPHFDPQLGYQRPLRFYQWRFTRPELRRELELRGFQVERMAPIHKVEGVARWAEWDMRWLSGRSVAARAARRGLSLVIPSAFIAHMVFAVARRRTAAS